MPDADLDGRVRSLRGMLLGGGAVSDDVADLVVQRHVAFWATQKTLVDALSIAVIDRDQYLAAFNDEVSALMRSDRRLMGDDAYAVIFGSGPDHADDLIDPEVFLAGEPQAEFDGDSRPGPAYG